MTSTAIVRVPVVVAMALVLAGCGGGSESATSAGDATAPTAGADTQAAAQSGAVTIDNLKFAPADLEVAAGSEVTWTNDDEAPHTISFSDEALKDSAELKTGDAFSASFDQPGEYAYICGIHPDMKGTVTVS